MNISLYQYLQVQLMYLNENYTKNVTELLTHRQTVDTMWSSLIFWAPGTRLTLSVHKHLEYHVQATRCYTLPRYHIHLVTKIRVNYQYSQTTDNTTVIAHCPYMAHIFTWGLGYRYSMQERYKQSHEVNGYILSSLLGLSSSFTSCSRFFFINSRLVLRLFYIFHV